MNSRVKAWQILYLVGLPAMGVSAYMLHEAIWPGQGIFLDLITRSPTSPTPPPDYPPGDFSRVGTIEYWLLYYIPFGVGAMLMVVGWYLRHTAPMPPHVTFDQMED